MATAPREDTEVMAITEQADGSAMVELPDSIDPVGESSDPRPEGEASEDPEDQDHPDDSEAVRAARRERRKARKAYHKRVNEERSVELDRLRAENQKLLERVTAVERKTQSHDIARLNAELDDQTQRARFAQAKMAEAISSGDGALHASATDLYYEARRAAEMLEEQKRQMTAPVRTTPIQEPDPRVERMAKEWLDQNSWYDPSGRDEDSEIAQTIDKRLVKEGYDPSSLEYWDELTNRLQKRLPHRYTDNIDDEPRRRRSPVTSSGREAAASSGGKANTFTLTADQVSAMKQAGYWENPEMRARMIKRYAEEARNRLRSQ
jgi:hypothetical protein